MSGRGSHSPAKKISGKNNTRPRTFAALAVLAVAATVSPIGNSPAMDSMIDSTSPPGLFGASAPKTATPATNTTRRAITAWLSWTRPCAASSHDGGTGPEADGALDGGRLARSVRAENREDLALGGRERDVADRDRGPVRLAQMRDLYGCAVVFRHAGRLSLLF